jgi:hypothetical protein
LTQDSTFRALKTSSLVPRRTGLASKVVACLVLAGMPCAAQTARPAPVAIDTSAMVSAAADENGDHTTGVILDAFASATLGRGFEVMVRPFVQQLQSGEWNRQVWLAALRFERRGPVGIRIEAGLIPPPVGLANLLLRPHLNSTIAQPSALFLALPAPALGSPRLSLLGAIYPYGVSATVSGLRWDARAAVMDASPLRPRRVFSERNPPQFRNVVVGAGVTPFVGFRVGSSITRGGWLRAGELPGFDDTQLATVLTVESEFSYRHTKVSAEWVRDTLDLGPDTRHVTGWFGQGQQALGPHWTVAGRYERVSGDGLLPTRPATAARFTGVEETVGYRVTPELMVRVGHRARRGFGQPDFAHEASVSLVWWRRWM